MLLDEEELYLALEIRDLPNHKVSFAAIDISNKKLIWKEIGFEEEWWIGMGGIKKGSILFYVYENDQNPAPTSYFLYSIIKQAILWQSSDFRFLSVIDEGVIGYTGPEENSQLLLVHPVSGISKIISSNDYNPSVVSENIISSYPFHYLEATEYYKSIEKYLVQNHGINPVKALDYLEFENAIIISYYLYSEGYQKYNEKFDNYLLVLNKKGEQLFNEKIAINVTGIGLGIFFVIKNQLIFSRIKSEIVSYQI